MPFRKKVGQLWEKTISRLGVPRPTRSANLSSTSSLNASTTPGNPHAPSSHFVGARSETNLTTASQANAANPEDQTSPRPGVPTLVLTQTSNEVVAPPQKSSAPDLGRAHTQTPSAHTSVAARPDAAAPAIPSQDAMAGVSRGLRDLFSMLNADPVGGVARAFGPLKAVVDELVGCVAIYEKVAKGRDEFKALQENLEGLFVALTQHFSRDSPPPITASMESFCNSIIKELKFVRRRQDDDTTRQYIQAGEHSDAVLACYRRIEGHLQRLLLNANLSMWKIIDEQGMNARLDHLNPALSARYNSNRATELKRGVCTPGTRVDVLGQMYGWVHDRGEGSVYWLNGMAGTGKTTIAYSLCAELNASHNLGASFFCSRLLPECRDVNRIVPSIAYQLAHFSLPFRFALSHVLEIERDVHTQLLQIQFEKLVIKPLAEVRHTLPENLVVVIDALDECGDKQCTRQILEALLTETSTLPIKFFVASRPEPEIRDQMQQDGHQPISRLVLHELDQGTVQGDIETYLRTALRRINPSDSQIAGLVQRSGILFIYAATVVRYIGYDNFSRNPDLRLRTILNISAPSGSRAYEEIDELYTVILRAAIDDPKLDDLEKDDMKQVLNTVLCAREPLSISALSSLLALHDIERVHAALRPLWSVLHVAESSNLVTTLHASFPDYMFDPKRSEGYWCDPSRQDHVLTRRCFDYIKNTKPQFNICGLESSYVPDEEVENLSSKIEKAISSELLYACRYWATHLEHASDPSDLIELVEDFLSSRLLLWMEIMNLKQCMNVGVGVTRQAEEWCLRRGCSEELAQLAHDAWRFVAEFTLNAISQSTPHIYVSMLPFLPESSPMAKRYTKRMQFPVLPRGPAISRRRLELLATWSINGEVGEITWSPDSTYIALTAGGQIYVQEAATGRAVVGPLRQSSSPVASIRFSPDGTSIVSGSEDGTICTWNVQTGQTVLGPLNGHTHTVTSVVFSSDGNLIVSGSYDKSIRIWDGNGREVCSPLETYSSWVTSVAYSPSNNHIIAGLSDNTIRMWNAQDGQATLSFLNGHTDWVTSITFSPDGTRVVSGSIDKTICIWDAKEGQIVLGPLRGHTGMVKSVAFSPDGTHVVSGSADQTVRVWDSQSGQTVLGPLEGHSNPVRSVAFSPDGSRIFSGSSDQTICIWDARSIQMVLDPPQRDTHGARSVAFSPDSAHVVSASGCTIRKWDARSGREVLSPFRGHKDAVLSVTFSPDGTRIASSSGDQTIYLWDAKSGQKVIGPLKGHTGPVDSIAFSPNGKRIVSGSGDRTIRLWDARSGRVVLGPLKGHMLPVLSVIFSPDGTRIASGCGDNTSHERDDIKGDNAIYVWDAKSGQKVIGPLKGHTRSVNSIAFSPNGNHIVSGSSDWDIRLWDARSGQAVLGPLKGRDGKVLSVIFSSDGTRIVAGHDYGPIRVWDAQSGQEIYGLRWGEIKQASSIAFSPNGACAVSAHDFSGAMYLWHTGYGKTKVSSIYPPAWVLCVDGWVTNSGTRPALLLWVPVDLRQALLPGGNLLCISSSRFAGLNFIDANIGDAWVKCYQPA